MDLTVEAGEIALDNAMSPTIDQSVQSPDLDGEQRSSPAGAPAARSYLVWFSVGAGPAVLKRFDDCADWRDAVRGVTAQFPSAHVDLCADAHTLDPMPPGLRITPHQGDLLAEQTLNPQG